jgi:hypothetical protein
VRGLLFVLSEPGTVVLSRFQQWYDDEHGPQRMALDGVHTGERWKAADGTKPTWLATYDIDLGVLETPAYRALRKHRSPEEEAILAELETLDRRIYAPVSDDGASRGTPGLLIAVSMSHPDEAELGAWYTEEHIPLLHAIPGWSRTRRFRLLEGEAPRHLALHELAGPEPLATDAYTAARSTEWRARVMAGVTARERRVFRHHLTFGGAPPG